MKQDRHRSRDEISVPGRGGWGHGTQLEQCWIQARIAHLEYTLSRWSFPGAGGSAVRARIFGRHRSTAHAMFARRMARSSQVTHRMMSLQISLCSARRPSPHLSRPTPLRHALNTGS